MKIINYRKVEKGSVKATFTVHFLKMDLNIQCTLMQNPNGRWVGMPQKPFEADGQKKYVWQAWFGKDTHKRFEEKILKMLDSEEFTHAVNKPSAQATQEPIMQDDCPF